MKISDLKSSFIYNSTHIDVDWFDLIDKKVPDLAWQQVYIIGDVNSKVPIVHYKTGDKDNLPGGKTEQGETVDNTIRREIKEEINCKVLSWYPIGYQKNKEPSGKVAYQLRVRAKLEKVGNLTEDIGGSVVGYSLVDLDDLNGRIQYGDIGERMVSLIKEYEGIK